MVEIGTQKFDAEKWCQPTVINLRGSLIPGLTKAEEVLQKYSDGYMLALGFTWGATIKSGQSA